jgi:hypothetical protein
MNGKRKVLSIIVVGLLAVGLVAGSAFSQGAGKGEGAAGAQPEGPKITMTGKIVFMKNYGGYVIFAEKPHEEHRIVNENKKVLGPLASAGKPVTVEGRLIKGAYFLFIEKIDGKDYQGTK